MQTVLPLPPQAVPAAPAEQVHVPVPEVALPDPTASPEVTLEQILAYADRNAPTLEVARAQARRGEAAMAGARPLQQRNPQITVGAGGRITSGRPFLEVETSLQQQLEVAGEPRLRRAAARRTRDVARAELEAARWDLHVRVHTLFLRALVARKRVEAAERVVAFAADVQRMARQRVEAGEDAPLSQLLSDAELALARERLVEMERQERALRVQLAEVAGWPPRTPPVPRGELPPVRRALPVDALARLAAEHHPRLRVQALALKEAEARLRLARRDAWPEPTLGVSYGREGGVPGNAADVWVVSVGVPIPVWNRNQGERARAEVALATARARRRALHRQWRARLSRAAANLDAAVARVEIYGVDVLPAVERGLNMIRRAYELGEIDLQAVSQTRERVLDTQMRALDALDAYVQAVANLDGLVGAPLEQLLADTGETGADRKGGASTAAGVSPGARSGGDGEAATDQPSAGRADLGDRPRDRRWESPP